MSTAVCLVAETRSTYLERFPITLAVDNTVSRRDKVISLVQYKQKQPTRGCQPFALSTPGVPRRPASVPV